jgi:hypothetical protein
MAISHAWTVLCDRSIIDRDTNNISLDVIEQVRVRVDSTPSPGEPTLVPQARVRIVSLWYRESETPERGTVFVALRTPSGRQVEQSFELNMDQKRVRSITELVGLHVDVSGIYKFIISLEQPGVERREVAVVPLEIGIESMSSAE